MSIKELKNDVKEILNGRHGVVLSNYDPKKPERFMVFRLNTDAAGLFIITPNFKHSYKINFDTEELFLNGGKIDQEE